MKVARGGEGNRAGDGCLVVGTGLGTCSGLEGKGTGTALEGGGGSGEGKKGDGRALIGGGVYLPVGLGGGGAPADGSAPGLPSDNQ